MKFHIKTLAVCSLFILIGFTGNIYSQLTGIDPTPDPNASKYKGQTEARVQEQNDRVNNIQPYLAKDEYGYFNFNAYLSNLGSTAGYVAIPGAFNENVDGSVEAWIYPTATTSSAPCIVGKGDLTTVGFLFGVTWSSNVLYMRFGGSPSVNTGGTTISLNQWTHVAATWTGGAGNYTIIFYVNGEPSGAPVVNAGTWSVGTDSMTIGSIKAPFSGKDFYGYIDEVKYWADVRTAAEIKDNRFVGVGDGNGANTSSAITSSENYSGLNAAYNFNVGGNAPDYIGGYNGYFRNGANTVYSAYAPTPIPYNYACLFPDGANDYLVIPDNSAFDLTSTGSIESWIYINTAGALNTIFHKGTTFATGTLAFYVSASNKAGINIGSHNYISTGPATLAANQWYHVAATWSGGPNFTVKLYVNGDLDYTATFNLAMPTNADPAWIGRYYTTTGNFNGYIDEVRIWNTERTIDEIKRCMFASGRGLLPNTALVGLWNFDGNLLNFSAITGIDGSFSSGGINNCHFSAFRNENNSGALNNSYIAHSTVVNRGGSPNPFPGGFIVKKINKAILDNQTTRDTISVSGSAALTSVNVFMSIRHTYCGDLSITLKSPNGQTRDLCSGNGGTGEDVLTFFADGSTSVTTSGFYPPWSNVAGPEVTMGTFGATNIQGNWILEVSDGNVGDQGTIIGWGLRFNDAITNSDPGTGIVPGKYELYQNYPNPFNPVTTIKFDIAKNSNVKLMVYDILGREVSTLVNEPRTAGSYEVSFDAANIASGTYFYKIEAGDYTQVKKMVILK